MAFWAGLGMRTTHICRRDAEARRKNGYCCSYTRVALTYGRALRWRFGHIGGGAGPQVNWWNDYDGPGVGLHISGEAYLTPLRWLDTGLDPSVTVTHQRAHVGVLLLGLKFGRLTPARSD